MFMNQWKKDVFTIPNLLSLLRLLLIPVYLSIYLRANQLREFRIAGVILILSCLTDMIDGFIARRYHMISKLGKVLDPLADKLTQLSLILCLSGRYPVLRWVLIILLIKEFFQVLTALVMLRCGKALDGAIPAGKVCTAVLFCSMILLVMLPNLTTAAVNAIALADSLFLIYAFAGYVFAFYGSHSQLQDFSP